MKILLVSNSARGHAIADALIRSPKKPEIVAITTVKDPGIAALATEHHVMDIMSSSKIVDIARKAKVDFAFIAPEDPIGGGLVDRLHSSGIHSVAPMKPLARVESSKAYCRHLLKISGIDANPKYRVFEFSSMGAVRELELEMSRYMEYELHGNYVVKYDGLKGGKGVKISGEHLLSIDAGLEYAMKCIHECGSVVIEEKLIGVEFSFMSFVSGIQVVDMPAVQDHKRANNGDTGPNTGGMGTYSDANHSLPFLLDSDIKKASEINQKIAAALLKDNQQPFRGILYGGFIATKEGVRVIEYNARFGDPESLNVLSILESDFVDICTAIINGTLTPDLVKFANKATVCKYITPKSYPDAKNEVGQPVEMPKTVPDNVKIYYGDVNKTDDGVLHLGGSRSIAVVGIGDTLNDAEQAAQATCEEIVGPVRYRSDIGTVDLVQKRIDLMSKLRRDN